jgi:hypothetical protein
MFTWHVVLLPLGLVALVVVHVLLVRLRGVVPPFPARVASGGAPPPAVTAVASSQSTSAGPTGTAVPPTGPTDTPPSAGAGLPGGADEVVEGEDTRP